MEPLPSERAGQWDSSTDVLPLPRDPAYEILLRLPAKDLCCLRTVSRAWLSLPSDPQFIVNHAARHPAAPLIAVSYHTGYTAHRSNRVLCDIIDLSGRVIKRVHARGQDEDKWVMFVHSERLCIVKGRSLSCQLLNPATGVVQALPEGLAREHAAHQKDILRAYGLFGQVASTGNYKMLRVLTALSNNLSFQPYEVFTLDGSTRSDAQWRVKQAPPYKVALGCWSNVVIDGIVYFLLDDDAEPDRIASFNLEMEEWSASILGPISRLIAYDAGVPDELMDWSQLTVAQLSGNLVMACHSFIGRPSSSSLMELLFLVDCEKGLWAKQYNIQINIPDSYVLHPLLVLNDGGIVFICIRNREGILRIYNPRTNTSTDVVQIADCGAAVGLYTGSLLSLANGAINEEGAWQEVE